ncbi:MAG: hypothetical protein ISS17_08110 [Bacteroidales bacterium]|nr:hypothetical protein [Bacteroidales bacterium]
MKYQIKIENAPEAKGTIDLQRLSVIADGIRKISEGALQIRLRGFSLTKGRKKVSLHDALRVSLSGIKEDSTIIELTAEQFSKTLEPFQTDIFRFEAQQELPEQTPVSLFIKSFQDALSDTPESDLLDKPLLQELRSFKKAFMNDNEVFFIYNQGNLPELRLSKQEFAKIKQLEEEIPEPEPVLLNGTVEELKYSKLKVRIKTEEGIVDGFLGDGFDSETIAPFWGKEISLTGTAHYKPGGKSVIEIDRVFKPSEGDAFFSKKPRSETVEQQIDRQIREGKKMNPLPDIVGKWPGDETFEELLEMLTK